MLRDHYEIEEVTDAAIRDASECNFHEMNSDYTPHSRAVVQHFLKEGDQKKAILSFVSPMKK